MLGLLQALHACGKLDHGFFNEGLTALRRLGDAEETSTPRDFLWKRQDTTVRMPSELEEPRIISTQPHICALFKPPGWTVTVRSSAGLPHDHDAKAEPVQHDGQFSLQSWVAEAGDYFGNISTDAAWQHGLVHRLDRDTSGVILCARTYCGFYAGQLQFVCHKVTKRYVCLCHGAIQTTTTFLTTPITTENNSGRVRSYVDEVRGRRACTELTGVHHLLDDDATYFSLVEVLLHTGRTHQIRVHLSSAGHPLVGDPLYGNGQLDSLCSRIFLHAHSLQLDIGDGLMRAFAPLPADLTRALEPLAPTNCVAKAQLRTWLSEARGLPGSC